MAGEDLTDSISEGMSNEDMLMVVGISFGKCKTMTEDGIGEAVLLGIHGTTKFDGCGDLACPCGGEDTVEEVTVPLFLRVEVARGLHHTLGLLLDDSRTVEEVIAELPEGAVAKRLTGEQFMQNMALSEIAELPDAEPDDDA